jgi:hypothetical protein
MNDRLKPYTGGAAQVRGCPTSFDPAAFASAHPGLFQATGWAHHPYSLTTPPRAPDDNRDDATLSGTGRLTNTLDTIFGAYGQHARLPIWITEYGYQTDPPDPTIGISWWRQADWLDDATFRAYRNPRIVAMAQFLLVDDGPISQYKPDDPRYWGSFQTGLETQQGRHKPSYDSYQHPIDVLPRRQRAGRQLRVFGQLRTAGAGAQLGAQIQFRSARGHAWRTVKRVEVADTRHFLDSRVTARRSGSYRIVWQGGSRTRSVAVRVR